MMVKITGFFKTNFSVKPRIDRTNLKTTTIKVGKQIFLDVDVAGEPAPEIRWFLLGNEITTADRVTVENVPYNTKLTIVDGKRGDSGKYKISATNEHGSDQEMVELVVLGPPSRPMGKFWAEVLDNLEMLSNKIGWIKNHIHT
jgi:hypothetical protein